MPNEDLTSLYNPQLYAKAIKEGIHPKAITDIILHLCWEDEGKFTSYFVVFFFLIYINRLQQEDYRHYSTSHS